MTFIDWSDAAGMLDLYQEFVRDERNACPSDEDRQGFLSQLLDDVSSIREAEMADALQKLRAIHESIRDEFSADPASLHLGDLIHELEGSGS